MKHLARGGLVLLAAHFTAVASAAPIDRHAVVTRHNVEWNTPQGTLPLGNGEFCFTADATGLQTFAGNSMAHWGWHSFPLPPGWTPDKVPPTGTFAQGRLTGGDSFPAGSEAIRHWMFDNPHRLNLGRLRLRHGNGRDVSPGEVNSIARHLDLWSGLQTSAFEIGGHAVRVQSCAHPQFDAVAIRIESEALPKGALEIALDFPYAALANAPSVGDFARDDAHETAAQITKARADFARRVDGTRYHAALAWAGEAKLLLPAADAVPQALEIRKAEYGTDGAWADVTPKIAGAVKGNRLSFLVNYSTVGADPAPGRAKRLRVVYALDNVETRAEIPDHQTLQIGGAARHLYRLQSSGDALEIVLAFGEKPLAKLPTFASTKSAAAASWERFWKSGGAIDLSGSRDPRWRELERRIVLSQYQTAVQSSGSWPPAETGLLGIDPWRGQFHMEMVWWHLAHFSLWNRGERADAALQCYQRFAPAARQLAQQLGYAGLKWPKSVGPEGRSAPWSGNQVLLWKQPHPIFFAELEYRRQPTRATLQKWRDIVFGTAEHMADYPTRDANGIYHLAPAMPPSEQGITRDTVFDLAYWRWGLEAAQRWRERLKLPREPHWDEVRKNLAPLPEENGVFVHSAEWRDTYTKRAWEHPDPIGVLGMLPPLEGVDSATARRTTVKVWESWNWNRTWGWDLPWMAMAAARVGEPQIAIEALLKDSDRNRFDERGVNTGGPCPYLPGNGGLLYAVAMMAAGWDGAPKTSAPGFPDDGSWSVRFENLAPAP